MTPEKPSHKKKIHAYLNSNKMQRSLNRIPKEHRKPKHSRSFLDISSICVFISIRFVYYWHIASWCRAFFFAPMSAFLFDLSFSGRKTKHTAQTSTDPHVFTTKTMHWTLNGWCWRFSLILMRTKNRVNSRTISTTPTTVFYSPMFLFLLMDLLSIVCVQATLDEFHIRRSKPKKKTKIKWKMKNAN